MDQSVGCTGQTYKCKQKAAFSGRTAQTRTRNRHTTATRDKANCMKREGRVQREQEDPIGYETTGHDRLDSGSFTLICGGVSARSVVIGGAHAAMLNHRESVNSKSSLYLAFWTTITWLKNPFWVCSNLQIKKNSSEGGGVGSLRR